MGRPRPQRGEQHAHRHDGKQHGQIDVGQGTARQLLPPAHHHVAERARQRDREAAGGAGGDGLRKGHAAAGQVRDRDEAAARAEQRRQDADANPGASQPQPARQGLAGGILGRLAGAAQHLPGRPAHEHRKHPGQQASGQIGDDAGAQLPAQQDAGHQHPDHRPQHGTGLVVSPQAGQRGEHDGGQRRGQGHLHDQVGRHAPGRKDHRQERHHHHAAAHAEQAGHEAGARPQRQQAQQDSGGHAITGTGRPRPDRARPAAGHPRPGGDPAGAGSCCTAPAG